MTFNPDLSEKGKNLARKRRILPQKTVFWVLESLLSKSLQILSRLFLQEAKKTCSLQVETSCSTVLNSVSQCARVRMSNMSDKTWIGVPGEQNPFLAAWIANWTINLWHAGISGEELGGSKLLVKNSRKIWSKTSFLFSVSCDTRLSNVFSKFPKSSSLKFCFSELRSCFCPSENLRTFAWVAMIITARHLNFIFWY